LKRVLDSGRSVKGEKSARLDFTQTAERKFSRILPGKRTEAEVRTRLFSDREKSSISERKPAAQLVDDTNGVEQYYRRNQKELRVLDESPHNTTHTKKHKKKKTQSPL